MSKRQENILLSMWGVALVATMGSLYFSEIRGYEPCELCWIQRIFMYPLVIIIGIAYVQKNVKIALTTLVFSVIGGCISLYHYGIQKLDFLSDSAPACGRVPCTGQYINYLGFITIPFLALTAFVLIAGMSIYLWKSLKEEK
ncbi:disulfide bond formation protein B [Planomicrobium chinense]|uniref:disulfide formation protein C n=1 Tax=Planococcus chinensis TaxID=272917 RepID=UPI001CC8029D|nr:disulfide oxidoreductase [Planococcus chinensis]MBZ5202408.1 disulfide bond formation protein B [Planococcus chinensis]MCP2036240.1 disulfide bond formation protein DsbB [Planomicrobium sp. HSC-17F08]